MSNQARSTLGPPGPTAVYNERAMNILNIISNSWTDPAAGLDRRRVLGGPSSPGQVVRSCPTAHLIAPARSILSWPPGRLPCTGLTSWPSSPHCSHSSPHRRTHHGAKERSWARRPGVHRGRPGPPLPTPQPGATRHREGEGLPARPEVLLGGTGSPAPLPNAGDPTPRRGEATQDVLYCHFRGC